MLPIHELRVTLQPILLDMLQSRKYIGLHPFPRLLEQVRYHDVKSYCDWLAIQLCTELRLPLPGGPTYPSVGLTAPSDPPVLTPATAGAPVGLLPQEMPLLPEGSANLEVPPTSPVTEVGGFTLVTSPPPVGDTGHAGMSLPVLAGGGTAQVPAPSRSTSVGDQTVRGPP